MSGDILHFPTPEDDDEIQELVINTPPNLMTPGLSVTEATSHRETGPEKHTSDPDTVADAPGIGSADCTPDQGGQPMPASPKRVADIMQSQESGVTETTAALPTAETRTESAEAPLLSRADRTEVTPQVIKAAPVAFGEVQGVQPTANAFPGFPDGYSIRNGDVYLVREKNGEPEEVFLCSPIRVLDLFRDGDGSGWGRRVGVQNPDGKEIVIPVMDRDLSGAANKQLSILTDLGLRKGAVKGAAEKICNLLLTWNPPRRLRSTSRQGWADKTCNSFVLGDNRVIGNQDVIYLKPAMSGGLPHYDAQGTLEDWKRKVASLCVNNPLMMTVVSLAFTGPLLEVLNLQGSGLHLRGGSSRGKATLLKAAASVWGPSTLVQSWRTTDNALEATAAAANSKLLVLDELGEVTGAALHASAYMIGNGRGKSRSTGFGPEREPLHWRVALLSSGEISVAAKIAEAGMSVKAGQEVRLIDVAADERLHGAFDDLHGQRDGASFAAKINEVTGAFHGTSGPAFVEWLIDRKSEFFKFANKVKPLFDQRVERSTSISHNGVVRRVAEWFGLVAAAGAMASKAGITGWQVKDPVAATLTIFENWLEARKDGETPEILSSVERIREFLAASIDRFQDLPKSDHTDKSPIGWRDDAFLYIPNETWSEIHGGVNTKVAAREIEIAGYLIRGEGQNLMRKGPSSIPGRPRVYTIRKTIMTNDRPAPEAT